MSDDVTLDEIKTFAAGLSPWAHMATVGADGAPDVVPVHPAWEGDTLWAMVVRVVREGRNVAANPQVALHWQVTEKGDGVEGGGRPAFTRTSETKRRLWEGVFDYNLNDSAPGGPDNSPDTAFIQVIPDRALQRCMQYGMGGRSAGTLEPPPERQSSSDSSSDSSDSEPTTANERSSWTSTWEPSSSVTSTSYQLSSSPTSVSVTLPPPVAAERGGARLLAVRCRDGRLAVVATAAGDGVGRANGSEDESTAGAAMMILVVSFHASIVTAVGLTGR